MTLDLLRLFAISKLDWIKQQQKKLRDQERETPREYVERESHYVWGKRYLLKVVEDGTMPLIELKHSAMILRVRAGSSAETMIKPRDPFQKPRFQLTHRGWNLKSDRPISSLP